MQHVGAMAYLEKYEEASERRVEPVPYSLAGQQSVPKSLVMTMLYWRPRTRRTFFCFVKRKFAMRWGSAAFQPPRASCSAMVNSW